MTIVMLGVLGLQGGHRRRPQGAARRSHASQPSGEFSGLGAQDQRRSFRPRKERMFASDSLEDTRTSLSPSSIILLPTGAFHSFPPRQASHSFVPHHACHSRCRTSWRDFRVRTPRSGSGAAQLAVRPFLYVDHSAQRMRASVY
jgi:hypothetical protein